MELKEIIDNAYNTGNNYSEFGKIIDSIKGGDPDELVKAGISNLIIDYLNKIDNVEKENFENYWNEAIKCFELIAELAKTESTRTPIGESGIMMAIAKAHEKFNKISFENQANFKLSSTFIQILRAYANLCFDHEKNRDLIYETHTIDKIVSFLQYTQDLRLVKIACGALCNISMDNEPIQNEICVNGGVGFLRSLIMMSKDSKDENLKDIAYSSFRVVLNLVETECGLQNFVSSGILQLMITLMKQYMSDMSEKINVSSNLQIIEIIINILDTVVENDNVQRVILEEDLLEPLLLFVEFNPAKDVFDEEEDETNFHTLKKSACKSIISVTMNDVCMSVLLNESKKYSRFINWMTDDIDDISSEREEIRSTGAYCIGNLARSDESCIKLVQDYKIMGPILEVLKAKIKYFENGDQPSRDTMKVLHAITGTLKNLCLAVDNRACIGETGLIEMISPLLINIFAQPIHYSCVGIIKNLCGLNELNAVRVMTGKEPDTSRTNHIVENRESIPYTYLITLLARSTSDNDTHVRNEGSRVVVNLVKSCWKRKEESLLLYIINNGGISCLLSLILGVAILQSADSSTIITDNGNNSESESHVRFDQVPTSPQIFPILQNEGILALVLLFSTHESETMNQVKKNEDVLIPQILEIMNSPSIKRRGSNTSYSMRANSLTEAKENSRSQSMTSLTTTSIPNELKNNACLLLNHLCNDDGIKEKFKDEIMNTLASIDDSLAGSSSNIDFVEDENTTYAGIKPDLLRELVTQIKNKLCL